MPDEQLLQLQRAQFRLAEIHQNNSDHGLAVDTYEALLSLKDSAGKNFSKEKVLMRLAECCYRLEKVPEGLGYLDRLQADIAPKHIYTLYLLRGKFRDL